MWSWQGSVHLFRSLAHSGSCFPRGVRGSVLHQHANQWKQFPFAGINHSALSNWMPPPHIKNNGQAASPCLLLLLLESNGPKAFAWAALLRLSSIPSYSWLPVWKLRSLRDTCAVAVKHLNELLHLTFVFLFLCKKCFVVLRSFLYCWCGYLLVIHCGFAYPLQMIYRYLNQYGSLSGFT